MISIKKALTKILNAQGTLLFNNDSQPMSGAITLSESAANYKMLEICFKTNDGFYDSAKVYDPNGKNVILWTAGVTAAEGNHGRVYAKIKVVNISGTIINTSHNASYYYTAEKDTAVTGVGTVGDYIAITQVIGYKSILGGGYFLTAFSAIERWWRHGRCEEAVIESDRPTRPNEYVYDHERYIFAYEHGGKHQRRSLRECHERRVLSARSSGVLLPVDFRANVADKHLSADDGPAGSRFVPSPLRFQEHVHRSDKLESASFYFVGKDIDPERGCIAC